MMEHVLVQMLIYQLFTKKGRSMERLSPTQAALHQHILRAAYQGGHIWGQKLDFSPSIPSPDEWDRVQLDTGLFCPLQTTIAQASLTSLELVRCGCLQGCKTKRCKCNKAALQCTVLCSCDGSCDN